MLSHPLNKAIEMTDIRDTTDLTAIFEKAEFPDAYKITYLSGAIVIPAYDDVSRDFGVTRSEYNLLFCLAHFTELTAQDVAKMTRRPRNSISRAVHRMQREGYLKRIPDPNDGRQAQLTITPKGRKMHAKIAGYLVKREAELLDVLDEAERAQLRETLLKLAMHAAGLPR
jgi:DNA-binding MarR family transcriptional regulator